ncbi:tRNA-uridine aminocarboxypropyltransferase 2 isoform X2 [Ahaetulla prasina]|uniref:tRNA-uridine aminocarboxypropyltransferase 2 isoform X2 n=1 Tax=Ahaetulla prasina TaxID=499056 RepID=UPI0026478F2D|nr:tRNA-uridine aminocarboxypropyltransferase 2 isoform X2 [Ahaetulla prasina]
MEKGPGSVDAAGKGEEQRQLTTPAPENATEEGEECCEGLWGLPVELSTRRPECGRCGRPQKVCLCPFLPVHPLKVSTCLYIIQHPAEESRVLRTVPLLTACLPEDKCKVLIGRRFCEDRYPELASICKSSNTLILYPGAGATNLEEMDLSSTNSYTIVIIDGTWSQAKDIFLKNPLFQMPKQTVLRPLQALCAFQIQHGAQVHHSKEHLLKNGLYDKPMPKNKRKLRRMELLVNNVKI